MVISLREFKYFDNLWAKRFALEKKRNKKNKQLKAWDDIREEMQDWKILALIHVCHLLHSFSINNENFK